MRPRVWRASIPATGITSASLKAFDGILVPGGFGKRGIEGMLNAIRYAREKQVPYFGICLGMQTACIEYRAQRLRTGRSQLQRVRSRHVRIASSTSCAS